MKKSICAMLLALLIALTLTGCNKKNGITTGNEIEVTKIVFNGAEITGLDLSKQEISMPDLTVDFELLGGDIYVAEDVYSA